ncbi:hypothetical protein ACB092_05G095800 [Castanea dentata]
MVTRSPKMVTAWLRSFDSLTNYYLHHGRSQCGMVSLQARVIDHTVHTLNKCVGHSCLIFQIKNAPSIPQSLIRFLTDWYFPFVRVHNIFVIRRLLFTRYNMNISNRVALFDLVGEYYRGLNQEMVYYGWTEFARLFGISIRVPLVVTLSDWSTMHLQNSQILYASLEACFCFELARFLYNWAGCTKIKLVQSKNMPPNLHIGSETFVDAWCSSR